MQVEHNQVNVAIIGGDLGDDCCNHIKSSVSFNNYGIIRVEMCQDGCLCKVRLRVSNTLVWSAPQVKGVSL